MSNSTELSPLRRIGNRLIDVPNAQASYTRTTADVQATTGPVARWLQWYSAHLSATAAAAGAAVAVHPLLWASAALPLGFLGASEVERVTNNARVRAQRPKAEADSDQATPAGRAVAA